MTKSSAPFHASATSSSINSVLHLSVQFEGLYDCQFLPYGRSVSIILSFHASSLLHLHSAGSILSYDNNELHVPRCGWCILRSQLDESSFRRRTSMTAGRHQKK